MPQLQAITRQDLDAIALNAIREGLAGILADPASPEGAVALASALAEFIDTIRAHDPSAITFDLANMQTKGNA